MTSERPSARPPRGPIESYPDEPDTRASLLARAARRLARAKDLAEVRHAFGEAVGSLLGQATRWELHAGGPSDSGEMPRVDGRVTALSGLGAGVLASSPERTMDGASSIVVAPRTGDGARDELVVPLGRAGRLGSLLVRAPVGAGFEADDAELVAALGAQVTLALDRLRSLALRGSQRRIKTDLRAAREVQQSLLPPEPPEQCGYVVRAAYQPCFEVGGDCYDFVTHRPGELTVLIGDAAGKGVAAAILMTRVSAEFRGFVEMGHSPDQVLAALNRSLTRRPAGEGFATALCVHLSTAAGRVSAANAGHILPLIRRVDGDVSAFARPSGAPLGFVDEEAYELDHAPIAAGDIVVLMTDGLLDALGAAADELGMQAAIDLVSHGPHDVDGLRAHILTALAARHATGDRRRRDDVTMVVIQVGARA